MPGLQATLGSMNYPQAMKGHKQRVTRPHTERGSLWAQCEKSSRKKPGRIQIDNREDTAKVPAGDDGGDRNGEMQTDLRNIYLRGKTDRTWKRETPKKESFAFFFFFWCN